MNLIDKYSDAKPVEPTADELEQKLFDLAAWMDDPSAAPIDERRRYLPRSRRLVKKIQSLRKESPGKIIITITPTDGSFSAKKATGVTPPR